MAALAANGGCGRSRLAAPGRTCRTDRKPGPLMRTRIVIVGSGPSGLLLGQLLSTIGVETVILERSSREHVLGRVRAGVLEQGTVELLEEAGAAARLHAEGLSHAGISLAFGGGLHRLDLTALTGGKHVTVYGPTHVTPHLLAQRERAGSSASH